MLNQIGIVWKLENRFPWSDWVESIKRYYEEHGNLPVPCGYEVEAGNLFAWIDNQRRIYQGKRRNFSRKNNVTRINWNRKAKEDFKG